jgi:hypothetical protein
MSGHQWHTGGHVTEVHTLAQRIEAIAERLGDAPLQIAARYYLSGATYLSGDYRGTEQVCRALMQSLRGQPTRDRFGLVVSPAVGSRAQLARALAERGLFDEGDAHGHEAIRIAEALDHPFSLVVGCVALAYLKTVRGELSQAARLLERAVAQCREWNITAHAPVAMASLGHWRNAKPSSTKKQFLEGCQRPPRSRKRAGATPVTRTRREAGGSDG